MLYIDHLNFLLCLLSSIFSMGASIHVILGETAFIDCYDPEIALKSPNFLVEVKFNLSIPGAQPSSILLYKPFQQKYLWYDPSYQGFVNFLPSGVLKKTNVVFMDEGTFICVSKDYLLTSITKKTLIIVLAAPVVEVKMIKNPTDVGKDVVTIATCAAKQGKPPALVNWLSDSPHLIFKQQKSDFTASSLTTVTSKLMLIPYKSYNKQTLRCEIRHAAFDKNNVTVVTLNITYPPDRPKIFVSEDKSYLTCIAEGNPPPGYEWTLPTGSNPPKAFGPSVKLLSMQFASSHQNDTYTCRASNSAGKSAPVSITSQEVQVSKAQSNVWVYVIIGVGAFLLFLLVSYLCCRFRKSRDKQVPHYSKQDYLIRHNTERYMHTPIEHANHSLHRPPSPVRPPPDDYYYDESDPDEHDVEIESDFSKENSFSGGSKVELSGPIVSFKKQGLSSPVEDPYKSKEAKFSLRHPQIISHQPSPKYRPQDHYPSSVSEYSDEDMPHEPPRRLDDFSDYEARSHKSDRSLKKGSKKPVQYTEI